MENSSTTPRGLRNNNPLNLRLTPTPWLGKVTTNTDGSFEQFISLEYGIRAAMINYRTILRRNIKNNPTVAALIRVWAPGSDGNDEMQYTAAVLKKAVISPYEKLDWKNKNQTCRLLWAMAQVECGREISFQPFENAYALAFKSPNAAA